MYSELIGVYHARGSLLGELAYVVGKVVGRAHCALCDITHGWSPRERSAFTSCRVELGVPWQAVHLDERSADVEAFTEGRTPCVVGRQTDGELVLLMDGDALEACEGDPQRFVEHLVAAMRHDEAE